MANFNTFAILTNPRRYDIFAASALDEGIWLLPAGDAHIGDRIAFWRTLDAARRRGVVAFAEVIGEAAMRNIDEEGLRFWRKEAPSTPQRRIRIRYVDAPKLPLWLGDDRTGLLSTLSVSRGQGPNLYKVSPEDWKALIALAGGWYPRVQSTAITPTAASAPAAPAVFLHQVEEQRAQEEAANAAEFASRHKGQGYATNAAFRKAVELRAMAVTGEYLRSLGRNPEDTSLTESYDFRCDGGPDHRYVEVKGTTGDGMEVFLTANEVKHAHAHPGECSLVVVFGIVVESHNDGSFRGIGGTMRVFSPWILDAEKLSPLTYRYTIPPGPS